MNKLGKTPVDTAKSPAAEFVSPAAVVADPNLTAQNKRKVLAEWEQDARLISVASEEGMSGGEPARLDEVKAAQRKLGDATAKKPSPTKSG